MEINKSKFANILDNLQDMSNDSTLLGGIDNDDSPPNFQTSSKSKKREEQDQSQIHQVSDTSKEIDAEENNNQKEIDPFDLKNFKQSHNEKQLFSSEILKRRSFNFSGNKIFNPLIEIQKLKEEVRIK